MWPFKRRVKRQKKFISWYRDPSFDRVHYLAWQPPYDHGQYSSATGVWHYSVDIDKAHRFDTYEEARKLTPTYDGSADIAVRTGVITVR